jgi:hypothetical protein
MGAGLAAPDARVVHTRQIVENEGRSMGKLDTRGCRQNEREGVIAEDRACGHGDERPPTMTAAEHSIAGGSRNLRIRQGREDTREEIFDGSTHLGFGRIEVAASQC